MVEFIVLPTVITLLSVILTVLYFRSKRGLLVTSVKNAIDSMITGIMFFQKDGFILLINERMLRLMTIITGKTQRNGRDFLSKLLFNEVEPGCITNWFEEQNIIILPDESAWQFIITELPVGKKTYIQLTATDISEQWKLTSELHRQNEMLLQRQEELNETIANLHTISRERETQRAKMRVHDKLGEHLSVLQGTIFGNQTPDYSLLRSLSQGLLDDLKTSDNDPVPQAELQMIQQIFQTVGVEVVVSGTIPEEQEKGQLIVDIAREAVNNAVRHGLATRVIITIEDTSNGTNLEITDNGYSPLKIKEGGGITGMRKKVEPFNGTLHVAIEPQFALSVELPGGKA